MEEVTVLGGGVNGITTALVLELTGNDTTLVTAERGDEISVESARREFATAWPAGAVYPVTVEKSNLEECFSISQGFFRLLWRAGIFGTRRQRLRHIFEGGLEEPAFASLFDNYRELEEESMGPLRSTADHVSGYSIDMFCVEMDFYMKSLYRLYREVGGEVVEDELSRSEFLEMPGTGVNCTGYWSRQMFDDTSLMAAKGHLIHVDIGMPETNTGEVLSYVYDLGDGSQVYCFPSTDRVVFGGSHLEGAPKIGGEWNGEEPQKTIEIDGEEVPERIVSVNSELINKLTGDNLEDNIIGAYSGYRPYREEGVRVEKEEVEGETVVHNYGHGGAGVTLSWGTALEVAQKIGSQNGFRPESRVASMLKRRIDRSI